MKGLKWLVLAVIVAAGAYGVWWERQPHHGPVDGPKIIAADKSEWLSYGRDYSETRYSPLDQINTGNVKSLGLAWRHPFGERQGLEGTPIMSNGVLYVTTDFSEVWAFDARTGQKLWSYVPDTHYWQINVCCGPSNRGVAIWHDKVYVGALDGRLIALNAKTGAVVWSVQTFDKQYRYSITGAPRVVKGRVLIGNGGAEFGVRGYLSAYDAETGKFDWRFYLAPGEKAQDGAASDSAMKIARPTWHGQWWKYGGGGTPWDSMAYDPDLDLLYIGGGNGSPWNADERSPGGGDNLFLGSIVAVRPETGKYVWHFQETPNDSWDFTSTQSIVLADLVIDGQPRKVLLHAPKNGYFYVLDRATGQFISGKPYGMMNWSTGLTPEGRPIVAPAARYDLTHKNFVQIPGAGGAHDWQPMSFSPKTGLVYIPQHDMFWTYVDGKTEPRSKFAFNTGQNYGLTGRPPSQAPVSGGGLSFASLGAFKGYLLAWDPVRQKAVFKVDLGKPFDGGVLSTGGDLVFQGTAEGAFNAYDDRSGRKLWSFYAQTGVLAAPMTYELDGQQYLAVLAGWGGTMAGSRSISNGPNNLLVFKLGGTEHLPPKPVYTPQPFNPPPVTSSVADIDKGFFLYGRLCQRCHGGGGAGGGLGLTGPADLRRSPIINDEATFEGVVVKGQLVNHGMTAFGEEVDSAKATLIRNYIAYSAHQAMEKEAALKQGAAAGPEARPPRSDKLRKRERSTWRSTGDAEPMSVPSGQKRPAVGCGWIVATLMLIAAVPVGCVAFAFIGQIGWEMRALPHSIEATGVLASDEPHGLIAYYECNFAVYRLSGSMTERVSHTGVVALADARQPRANETGAGARMGVIYSNWMPTPLPITAWKDKNPSGFEERSPNSIEAAEAADGCGGSGPYLTGSPIVSALRSAGSYYAVASDGESLLMVSPSDGIAAYLRFTPG